MSPKPTERQPWTDRFREPDAGGLIGGLPEESAELFRRLHAAWAGRDDWSASVAWRGWGWNWAICFGGESVEAALIADPEQPRAAVRMKADELAALHRQNAFKPVRTQMLSAKPVGPVVWTEWPVTNLRVVEWLESLEPASAADESDAS